MKWISIKDQCPPESEDVLLFREDGSCVVASLEDFYDAETGHFVMKIKETEGIDDVYSPGALELDATIEVTHWMPLPKDPSSEIASTVDVQLLNSLNASLDILSRPQSPLDDNLPDDVLHREASRKVKEAIVKLLTDEIVVE